ncbi:hypothetical protein LCGC14_3101820, partial [marine sediment metagenome]
MNKIPVECYSDRLDRFLNNFASELSIPQKKTL